MQPEDESKKKMLDILKRFHLEEEDMDSEGEDGMVDMHSFTLCLIVYKPLAILFCKYKWSGFVIGDEDVASAQIFHLRIASASLLLKPLFL